MPERPPEMMRNGRPVDPNFKPDEMLYRRVRPQVWQDDEVELDAIALPNMSVQRGKYGPPEWACLESEETLSWGVIGFRVDAIPAEIQNEGVFLIRSQVEHAPEHDNYPHSEVRAYESRASEPGAGTLIVRKLMDRIEPHVHLRWREMLRRKCRIVLHPT